MQAKVRNLKPKTLSTQYKSLSWWYLQHSLKKIKSVHWNHVFCSQCVLFCDISSVEDDYWRSPACLVFAFTIQTDSFSFLGFTHWSMSLLSLATRAPQFGNLWRRCFQTIQLIGLLMKFQIVQPPRHLFYENNSLNCILSNSTNNNNNSIIFLILLLPWNCRLMFLMRWRCWGTASCRLWQLFFPFSKCS